MIGFLSIGYEFAAELTYPIPEGTSSGILNFASEVFGILLTHIAGELLHSYGDMVANITLASFLFVGLLISIFIDGKELRRQTAVKGQKNTVSTVNTVSSTV